MAAKQFADVTIELNRKQNKLEELHNILREYQAQLSSNNLQMSAEQFKQYHRFMDYLVFVIKQQNEVVAISKREVANKRRLFVQYHKQNKGLTGYIENVEMELIAEQLKKEQKELDFTVTDNFFHKINISD